MGQVGEYSEPVSLEDAAEAVEEQTTEVKNDVSVKTDNVEPLTTTEK